MISSIVFLLIFILISQSTTNTTLAVSIENLDDEDIVSSSTHIVGSLSLTVDGGERDKTTNNCRTVDLEEASTNTSSIFDDTGDIDPKTSDSVKGEYDQLTALMQNHYERYRSSSTNNLSSRISLSRKADSSLVRSQQASIKKDTTTPYRKNVSLNIQNLTRILHVDSVKNTVRVQTRCTYDALVQYLLSLKQPMIPLVVPEFKSITIGGAILGGALESSSFSHGQVSDTVQSMIVLLANGTMMNISEQTHSELYHSIPGSYGSLVVLLEATIRVRPIQSKFIQLHLSTYQTIEDGISAMSAMISAGKSNKNFMQDNAPATLKAASPSQPLEFIDAIQYPDSNKFVVIGGNVVDQQCCDDDRNCDSTSDDKGCSSIMSELARTEPHGNKWFYELIYDKTHDKNLATPIRLYMPIYDYLFRYERGAFWMARPLQFSIPTIFQNPMLLGPFLVSWKYTRFLFGKLFTATILYRLLHMLDPVTVSEKFLIQDSYIPFENVTQYIQFIRNNIPISVPIWICPVKRPLTTQPLSPSGNFRVQHNVNNSLYFNDDSILYNVGVWGRVNDNNGIHYMQRMEQQMIQYHGRKMLYSITSTSQMSYETLYKYHVNGTAYHILREHYDATQILPALHEKLQLLSQEEIIAQQQQKKHIRRWKYWLSRLLT